MLTSVGQPTWLLCGVVCGEGIREGTMPLAQLWAAFQSLPPLPISQLGPSDADSPGGWVCVYSRTLWLSPTNSPVRLGVSPATPTTTGFTVRGSEALFPHAGTLGCTVCLAPQFLLLVYLHTNVEMFGLPATTSPAGCTLP